MAAPEYHVSDRVRLDLPPARAWELLRAELTGGARWWLPKNTFHPGGAPVDRPGGSVRVEVRPRGNGSPGPVLAFTAVTRECVPERLLRMEFVDGQFAGEWSFHLAPGPGGEGSVLAVDFDARPRGWARALARVVDIGAQHSEGVRVAFERLAEIGRAEAESAPGGTPRAGAAEGTGRSGGDPAGTAHPFGSASPRG